MLLKKIKFAKIGELLLGDGERQKRKVGGERDRVIGTGDKGGGGEDIDNKYRGVRLLALYYAL